MESVYKFIHHIGAHIAGEHPENIFLYVFCCVVMLTVLVVNHKSFKKGLEGDNGLWEAPEIVIYIWIWLFPQCILAVLFLKLDPPIMFWVFMGVCLMFALTGRWGLQWILNFKNGTNDNSQRQVDNPSGIDTSGGK